MTISRSSSAAAGGSLRTAQIVDDQQRNRRQILHALLTGPVDGGAGNVFQEYMGFTVNDLIALLDRGQPDHPNQMWGIDATATEPGVL